MKQSHELMDKKDVIKEKANIFQRMLEDKRAIRHCIQKGEDLKKLAEQRGIKFATPLWDCGRCGFDLLFHYKAWNHLPCLFPWLFLLSSFVCQRLYVQHWAGTRHPHPIDKRIALTVIHILRQFFSRNENAMIMVCDNLDGKEQKREMLFARWFMQYNDGSIRKYDASSATDDYVLYVSLFMHRDNPNARQLVNAFYDLVKNNLYPLE